MRDYRNTIGVSEDKRIPEAYLLLTKNMALDEIVALSERLKVYTLSMDTRECPPEDDINDTYKTLLKLGVSGIEDLVVRLDDYIAGKIKSEEAKIAEEMQQVPPKKRIYLWWVLSKSQRTNEDRPIELTDVLLSKIRAQLKKRGYLTQTNMPTYTGRLLLDYLEKIKKTLRETRSKADASEEILKSLNPKEVLKSVLLNKAYETAGH